MDDNNSPMLVTGMHRSGTTFVGNILSLASGVAYIHEPINKDYGVKGVPCSYPYSESQCGDEVKKLLPKILSFKCKYNARLKQDEPVLKKVLKKAVGGRAGMYMKLARLSSICCITEKKRPLIKDPIALLMSDYISREFNTKVVLLVRHPAAVYYSLKRLGWHFDFDNLLKQPEFIEQYGSDLKDKLYYSDNFTFTQEVGSFAQGCKGFYFV